MNQPCRILLADDHPIVRWGVIALLEPHRSIQVVAQAADSTELFDALETTKTDLVITDYTMPGGKYQDGVMMLDRLKRLHPEIKIIVLTLIKNAGILQQIANVSVDGILNKEGELNEIPRAIERVRSNHRYWGASVSAALADVDIYLNEHCAPARPHDALSQLSPRETEVIRMFLSGMPMTGIALATHRSIKTISNQKQSALRKLGCANDAALFQLRALGGLSE